MSDMTEGRQARDTLRTVGAIRVAASQICDALKGTHYSELALQLHASLVAALPSDPDQPAGRESPLVPGMGKTEALLKQLGDWAEYWSQPRAGMNTAGDIGWRGAAAEVKMMLTASETGPSPEIRDRPDYWAEIDGHPLSDWKYEVANDDTRQGYHAWALHRQEAQLVESESED